MVPGSDDGAAESGAATHAPILTPPICAPDRRLLLILVGVALVTRLAWVLWIHPPDAYVFSDMHKYVGRAQELASHGIHFGRRSLAWQTWGTHYVLALPLWLFGGSLRAGAVLWGLMGAAAIPAAYLLACRICTRAWMPRVVGIAVLCWYPNLSNSGYFLSETPFLCFQLWSTYALVVVLQQGRWAWLAGLLGAIAFAVRPQAALFFLLVLLTWALNRRRLPHVTPSRLLGVATPLLLTLAFSFVRFEGHTGYWGGIAENANMNFTAARCHNIVTQAFKTEHAKRRSEKTGNTRDGRRVSLPGFRMWAAAVDARWPGSPLALRPALDSETIRFVGYIGEPQVHREIRRQCYAKTGVLGQARYSAINLALLWFVGHQWPEIEKGRKYFYPALLGFRHGYQLAVWVPSLVGMFAALVWIRRRPGLSICAWQLVTSMVVASIFFGTIRLRTPYDPYAIILALEGTVLIVPWARELRRRIRRRGRRRR